MAVPKDDDLLTWEKHPANPILTTKLHKRKVYEWRDPFLFKEGGRTPRLGSHAMYFDVTQSEVDGGLAQKRRLLVVCFDQRNAP